MQFIIALLSNIGPWVAAINALLVGGIAIGMLLPGVEPERSLQAVVDFLAKFSKK